MTLTGLRDKFKHDLFVHNLLDNPVQNRFGGLKWADREVDHVRVEARMPPIKEPRLGLESG
jgi:hypothetical protein